MGWQRLPISAFLRKSDSWVQPEPDRIYQQIRVRLWGKGLTLRARVTGATIAARRQLRVSAGQFLISRIDARHGAFGIVPHHLDGALVSNDFPCFDIDERVVLPRYLEWYTRTDQFVDLCRRASEGSTNRVRIREDRLLSMEVPVPSLPQQEMIAAKLERVAALTARREEQAVTCKHESHAILQAAYRKIADNAPRLPMAAVAPLKRRPVEVHPDRTYPELGVRSFGRGPFHKPILDGTSVGSKKLFQIREGDLLLNIVFAWEGAVAVARPEDDGYFGSHRFLTCVPDQDLVTSDYLCYHFLTPSGTKQLGTASPGGAGRNRTLGLKKLDAIHVPVPPIRLQTWFSRLLSRVEVITGTWEKIEIETHAMHAALLRKIFDAPTL